MSEPKSKIRRQLRSSSESKMLTLPAALAKHGIGSFLDSKELSAISQTCTQNRNLYKNDCKTSELLFYGLNINKARKKKLIELLAAQNPKTPSVILNRVNGRQVYFSKQLKRTVNTRVFGTISSLEAAVLCGDFPLVRLLLENLPDNQNQAAVLQLKTIRKNLESDPRSFVSLMIPLQQAYKELDNKCVFLIANGDVDALEKLKGLIGENQKTLPWFILQVFCRLIPHSPLPDFTKEPERECVLADNSELDLDYIGCPKTALYKGFNDAATIDDQFELSEEAYCIFDSMALDKLCAVIKSELDKIIKLQEQKLLLAAYPVSGRAKCSP